MTNFWNSENAQNWTGAVVLAVVSIFCIYLMMEGAAGWSQQLSVASVLFVAQLSAFIVFVSAWAEERPQRMFRLLWLEAVLIVALYFLVDVGFVAILGIVWMVQAAELYSARTTMWLLLGAVLIFTVSQLYHFAASNLSTAVTQSVTLGLFHLFAVSATRRARREQQLREETAALNRELIATRELLSQHSRQNERLRIARDLHDLLGHHMTALILNLELGTHISEGKARQQMEQALALGKLLLSDLRTAVSELRDADAINLRQSVHKMIAGIPNLRISVDFTDVPAVKELDVAEILLRCIQEALTNVLRHSNASHCQITLTEHYNHYFLTVKDNGQASSPGEPGNGLIGMRERVREAGGEVSFQQEKEGFLLEVKVPVESAA